jgi:hypothetical protein
VHLVYKLNTGGMLKKIIINPFAFFFLLTIIIFWPISLHFFTLKNDALTYYYPVRTLISDALNNNELPLWTPFINMGYPLHADMQSGAFNPVIWLFSFCTNYSLYGFHLELLSYLIFAGIGFYFLSKEFGYGRYTSLLIGLGYECSGFITDSVQFFVCISAACYLPFIVIFFKKMITGYQIKHAVLTGFFLFLLFTGSYPALFIIIIYFLIALAFFYFFKQADKSMYISKVSMPVIILVFTFVLLSLPAIISFLNHLPFIERGKKQSLDFAQQNSLSPYSIISFFNPFSTSANENWLNTDPLMRSVYFGIIPLLLLLYAVTSKTIRKVSTNQFLLVAGIIMFALALGDHFFLHKLIYNYLPLINTFRHPALFRLFGIFCLLIVAGYAINQIERTNDPFKIKILKKLSIHLLVALLLFAVVVAVIFRNQIIATSYPGLPDLSTAFTRLNFIQRFLLQLPVAVLLLLLFYFKVSEKKTVKTLLIFCIADFFITTQFCLPLTIIGAKRFTAVTQLLNRNTEKFPVPEMNSISSNVFNSSDSLQLMGSKLPYLKKIGRNDYFITPGNLSSQDNFFTSSIKESIFKNPVIYFADTILYNYPIHNLPEQSFAIEDSVVKNFSLPVIHHLSTDSIHIIKFSANFMSCEVNNKYPATIVYLQNFYPGWKAFTDDKQITIQKANITFMAVDLPGGKHLLTFKYDPKMIKIAWYFSLFLLTLILLYFARIPIFYFLNKHQYRNTKRQSE